MAAGIVLFRVEEGERRYLLVRSALTRRPIWEFPKGGVEAGESDEQAAERELQEEAGLAVGDYAVLDGFREEERYVFTQGKGEARVLIVKRVVYFLAEARTAAVTISHEAEDFRWATYEQGLRMLRFPGKRLVLERAEAALRRRSGEAPLPQPPLPGSLAPR
jgi:8-oxo-dGTP pyrophosphatase MutT (NUDIX family)